jgi:hypothetical protein
MNQEKRKRGRPKKVSPELAAQIKENNEPENKKRILEERSTPRKFDAVYPLTPDECETSDKLPPPAGLSKTEILAWYTKHKK